MASSVNVKLALVLAHATLVFSILPDDYQSRTALEKQALLWQQILSEPYQTDALPSEGPSPAEMANVLNPAHLRKYFERTHDERAVENLKLVHTYGICAKARLNILPSSWYTGIFKTGAVGIARPSAASFTAENLSPSLAYKALIDHTPSVNFHTLFSIHGQGRNRNWFANAVSNQIESNESGLPIEKQMAAKAFRKTLEIMSSEGLDTPEEATLLGLYEHAAVEADGTPVAEGEVVAPWLLEWVPNAELAYSETEPKDFRLKLAEIPAGSALYGLVAYRYKEDALEKRNGELIGHLVTESELIATKYCDKLLLFQHPKKPWAAN